MNPKARGSISHGNFLTTVHADFDSDLAPPALKQRKVAVNGNPENPDEVFFEDDDDERLPVKTTPDSTNIASTGTGEC